MSVADDLSTVAEDLTTAQAAVSQAVTDLSAPAVPSVGDQVLEAVIPVLTAAGYTVTPPAATAAAEDETAVGEQATDTSTEA